MVSGDEYFTDVPSRASVRASRVAACGCGVRRSALRRAAVCGGERREAGVSLTGAHGGHGPVSLTGAHGGHGPGVHGHG